MTGVAVVEEKGVGKERVEINGEVVGEGLEVLPLVVISST